MRTETEHSPASGESRPTGDPLEPDLRVATLLPTQAPGRLTRKARRYLPQIVRLRAQGYTLEAIQEALAAAGVRVSLSTVRREAIRTVPPTSRPEIAPDATCEVPARPAARRGSESPAPPSLLPLSSGKDYAAAFAQSKSNNVLTQRKERS